MACTNSSSRDDESVEELWTGNKRICRAKALDANRDMTATVAAHAMRPRTDDDVLLTRFPAIFHIPKRVLNMTWLYILQFAVKRTVTHRSL